MIGRTKRGLWMLLAALLLVAAAWPPGGSPHPWQAGEAVTLTGRLTAIEPGSEVLVRVEAGVPVTLTLTSPDFDTVLAVYDGLGQRVAYNDDNDTDIPLPRERDSALVFTPQASGPMIVRVSSFAPGESGAYTLRMQGAQVVEQHAVSILRAAGGPVAEGSLAQPQERAAYSFAAAAGATITLTLTSPDFDPVLEVYDAAGALLAENDDHPAAVPLPRRTDSALTFQAPADGNYAALVRSFEGAGAGRFRLLIEGATFGPQGGQTIEATDAEERTCDGILGRVVTASSSFGGGFGPGNLIDGDPATGWSSRADDDAPYIIFEVSGGQPLPLDGVTFNGFSASPGYADDSVRAFEVAVSLSGGDPAAFTTVLQAEAPQVNAPITYNFPPVEARYVLLRPLTNYGGSYFQATEFKACTTPVEGLSGEPPYVIQGRLRPDQPYVEYRLYALEDATLTATLVSSAFDPVLEVYTADGVLLADNDDHPPEFPLPSLWDSALRLAFSTPGMFTARVRSFAGGGPFTLTIDGDGLQARPPQAPALPPCRDVSSAAVGGSVAGFSSEFGGRWLAAYLIDGDEARGWASAPGAESARTEYVILDLAGDAQTVAGFRINPSATGGDGDAHNVSRFAVLVSTTDARPASFVEVFSTLLGERYRHTLSFELPQPAQARYVMLQTRDTFGGRWHEVAEFTVCAAGP